MEQTQIEKLFSEARKKDERIKELETALIEMKKGFDTMKNICDKLIAKCEKEPQLTFDNNTYELIKKVTKKGSELRLGDVVWSTINKNWVSVTDGDVNYYGNNFPNNDYEVKINP